MAASIESTTGRGQLLYHSLVEHVDYGGIFVAQCQENKTTAQHSKYIKLSFCQMRSLQWLSFSCGSQTTLDGQTNVTDTTNVYHSVRRHGGHMYNGQVRFILDI